MMDQFQAKQALSDMVDLVADLETERNGRPVVETHPAYMPITMPPQLSSQVFITGGTTKVFLNHHDELMFNNGYSIEGETITINQNVMHLAIETAEARWFWDCTSQRWWIAGIDPDFYYKLREAACDQSSGSKESSDVERPPTPVKSADV
jgi:hypothetical protein